MSDKKPTLADQLGNSLPIISSTARAAFVASHFILALGSGFAIMYLVLGAIGDNLNIYASSVIAWIGSLIWYKAIENPLRKFILFAWAYLLIPKSERADLSENLKRTGKSSAWVTVILLTVTLSLSLLINVDIAEGITTEQDSTAEIAQSDKATSSYDRDVELLRDQVEAARARDAKAVKEAKSQAAIWIAQAEGSKGRSMRDLLHKGNDWAERQLRSAIRRAGAKGEKHIAQAKSNAEAPALQLQLTSYVGARSASRDTVATMTAGLVTARRIDFLETKGRRNWILFIAVCFVLVVFVSSARLLVLACLETGEDLDSDPGEGVTKVAGRMLGKLNAKLGQKLDEQFGDKLALVPVVAKSVAPVGPVATTTTTAPTPVAKPVVTVAPTATPVVGQDFEAVAASCSPEDVTRYKDQFRHNQKRQHTSARATKRAECRDRFKEAKGVLVALGYKIVPTGDTYRQTHQIDGKAKVVTYKKYTWRNV